MSNYDQGNSDPRMRNGWAEYQRLVLAELERHNKLLSDLEKGLNEIHVKLALLKEENGKIKTMQQQIVEIDQRIGKQETANSINDGVQKYKKWIIGVIATILLSGLLPILTVFLKLKGIG